MKKEHEREFKDPTTPFVTPKELEPKDTMH
jgi:hypothetical protein